MEVGGGEPAVFDQPELLVVGELCRGGGGDGDLAGEVYVVDAVVVAVAVAEPRLADPDTRAEVVEFDTGFFGDFTDGGLFGGFVVVESAAGEFPPVVAGVVGVSGVDKQYTVVLVKEQDAGAEAGCGDVGGGGIQPVPPVSLAAVLVEAACVRGLGQKRVGSLVASTGSEVSNGVVAVRVRRTVSAE
jgi:hypothetical protein